jgi:demethylmenaquinone methyltransferase/2-methoxy-6-polyprenyl-1,4-benzoquinol methylase
MQWIHKNIFYVQSDAQSLSFQENSFDHVTMAFGLRNTANIGKALESIYKILKARWFNPGFRIFKS